VPIEVYCAYCGKTIARFRTLMSLSEIERRTLERCKFRCPNCGAPLTTLSTEDIQYEIKHRTARRRRVRKRRRTLRARSRVY